MRKYHYRRLSPAQFSAALNVLNLSANQFAKLSGFDERRVTRMLEGYDGVDVPHQVTVMLNMFTLPGAVALAQQVADEQLYREEEV